MPALRVAAPSHRGPGGRTPLTGTPRPSRALLTGTFVLLCLIWGTTWAAIKLQLRGIPPFAGVALRFGLASVVLLALAPRFGVRFGATRRERVLWVAIALLSFCGSYGLVYWAEANGVPSGLAAVLFATFPLLTAALAHGLLPGERLSVQGVAGMLVGLGGLCLLFSEDFARLGGEHVARNSAILLLAPFVSAVANVAAKRWGHDVHPISLSAVPMGLTAVLMGAFALVVERNRPILPDLRAWAALVYLAIFGSAVTFSLYYWLLRHLPVTRVSLIAYLTPMLAVVIGTVWLHEPLTGRLGAGSGLVLAGVALAMHRPHR
jgi:drug/metabolite transporter (DMT)-like permease